MAIDISQRHSPGWWMNYLSDKLTRRNEVIKPLYARYEGDTPEPETLRHAPETARRFFRISRVGFAEMIIKAVKYSLAIQSISTDLNDDPTGDSTAWKTFKSTGMLRATDQIFKDFLVSGRAYGIVQRYQGKEYFTAEDPRQVYAVSHPFIPGVTQAAIKRYYDDLEGHTVVRLWVDGRTYRSTSPGFRWNHRSAVWDPDTGGADGMITEDIYGSEPPVYEFISEDAVGEFQRHLDDLDRVDHLILQGMSIATLQAFKQRAIRVPEEDMPDEDPDTGEPIDYDAIFESDPGALWKMPATADIWESGNVDLTPVWTGLDRAIQILSATTFTPLAMFSPEGQNQSAAGASFARESRTFKVEDRQPRLGEVLERALAAVFRLQDQEDSRATPENIRVVWKPAERYSLAEKADAMTKLTDLPWETRMTDVMQYSAADVERMKRQRLDDSLDALVAEVPEGQQATPQQSEEEPLANRANALGQLIRSGVQPESAARAVDLEGIEFFPGFQPVTIRTPEDRAEDDEQ